MKGNPGDLVRPAQRRRSLTVVAMLCAAAGCTHDDAGAGLLQPPASAVPPAWGPVSVLAPDATLQAGVLGSWRGGMYSLSTPADPPVYDPITRRVFNGSGDRKAVDIIDIGDPGHPAKVGAIDVSAYGDEPQALALHESILVVTVVTHDRPEIAGVILFFNVDGIRIADPIALSDPNKAEFSHDGRTLVVTQSGFAGDGLDPESGIAVVAMGDVPWDACRSDVGRCRLEPRAAFINFKDLDDDEAALRAKGVRLYVPGATVAKELEIEGLALSPDSRHAYVTFERANAIGKIDLRTLALVDIVAAGTKDHSRPGNGCDCSDRDGANVALWPVRSFSQPDGIAVYRHRGQDYLVVANEGDPRSIERRRVRDLTLDPSAFPDAASLQSDSRIGRLVVSGAQGDTDGDGDFDELWMLGSRSFSIRTADGTLVYDSGDDMEQITAANLPDHHNAAADGIQGDVRSDDRGPEPEHVAIGRIGARTYAFITSEHMGGVYIHDITNPFDVRFQQYINNRNFAVAQDEVCGERGAPALHACELAGDLEPEGVTFVPAALSPTGRAMLLVNHELSDSVAIYDLDGR
jgi:2',3'-cyclic-nucleotide 2'-phosphodiesterase/3'-nucleotidase/5'-nucleotidase